MSGLIVRTTADVSTLSAGPVAAAGATKVTVALAVATLSALLVAVIVTVAGAGYGVWYNPVGESVPGLSEDPAGALRFHTNDVSLAPVTVTLNCSEFPIVTVEFPGVSVRVTADLYCAVTVVLASAGYPESSSTGDVISGLDGATSEVAVTHAGTALNDDGETVTAGGRVLSVTALGADTAAARATAYAALDTIDFPGRQLRRDIAEKVVRT